MKVTKQETLYHEDYGATLKHKCGKKDSNIVPSLFFSHFFVFFLFFGPSLFYGLSLFWGLLFLWPLLFFFFIPHLGQCSRKWWSSHFYLFTTQWLQLDTRTKYDSIWMPPAVYRDMQWTKSDMYENYERWLCHKYDVNYMIMQSNMTMMNVSW